MNSKQLTKIAFIAAMLFVCFRVFSHILYLEMITFLIFSLACVVSRKEIVFASILFACIQLLLYGILPWNIAYLCIFPIYAYIFSLSSTYLMKHSKMIPIFLAFFSFLTGQLVELPFLLISKTVTMIYILMGVKTSLIQGCLTYIVALYLFDPVHEVLKKSVRRSI